jgi:hypothetical protein
MFGIDDPIVVSMVSMVSDVAIAVCSVIGLAFAVFKVMHHFDERQIPSTDRKKFYWDFFIPQYLDGSFVFHDKETNKEEKIDFKDARNKIEETYMLKREWTEDGHKKFIELAMQTGTKEHTFSYRVNVALNRVGQAAFTGVIPIEYVIAISADMILKDWDKSKGLIKDKIDYDELNHAVESLNAKIKYSRRFAQWLATVCAMYLAYEFQNSTDKKDIITTFRRLFQDGTIIDSSSLKDTSDSLVKMLEAFQSVDETILAPITKKYVTRLTKSFKGSMKKAQP